MSQADLATVVGQTKFGFAKYEPSKTIIHEGDVCDHLYFLLSGELEVRSIADNHHYAVVESVKAPMMLQPERIFGLTQRFTSTFTAIGTCHFLTLDKQEVIKLSDEYLIFRLNLFNILSTSAQKWARQPWQPTPPSVGDRIILFFLRHCIRPAGEKVFTIRMKDLAMEVSDSRLNVSHALNAMQNQGFLFLSRGKITIPRLELLVNKISLPTWG